MASWKPLNVLSDSDSESEEEVDNTKELRIEEALKLYQNTLRLHAQGPESFPEALDAYAELFRSEIWSWDESRPEWDRPQKTSFYDSDDERLDEADVPVLRMAGDGQLSTLPQMLFAALRNNGQYMIDITRGKVEMQNAKAAEKNEAQPILNGVQRRSADFALGRFVAALGHDDTDLELWRKTGRIAGTLGSRRIERFCLEAVLNKDQDGQENRLENPGIEESLASDGLIRLIDSLPDTVSLNQSPFKELKCRKLSSYLRSYRDPYPFYPSSDHVAKTKIQQVSSGGPKPQELLVDVPDNTWTAVGIALLQSLFRDIGPGAGVRIKVSTSQEQSHEVEDDQDATLSANNIDLAEQSPTENIQESSEPMPVFATKSPDAAKQDAEEDESDTKQPVASKSRSMSPRKRTSSSAGLAEDGPRGRSKRIKAREAKEDTVPGGDKTSNETQRADERQELFSTADNMLFDYINSALDKVGASSLGPISAIRKSLQHDTEFLEKENDNILKVVIPDLKTVVDGSIEKFEHVFASDRADYSVNEAPTPQESAKTEILAHLDQSTKDNKEDGSLEAWKERDGLMSFVNKINSGWYNPKLAATEWIIGLLGNNFAADQDSSELISSYELYRWSAELREIVFKILNETDEELFLRLQGARDEQYESTEDTLKGISSVPFARLAENILELHLDILTEIYHPGTNEWDSIVLKETDRCARWADLANHFIRHVTIGEASRPLMLRHLWGMTFFISLAVDSSQEHTILCIRDLKKILLDDRHRDIILQNNKFMPEISSSAADREIAKITMKDLFLSLFRDDDNTDEVDAIEKLELILNPVMIDQQEIPQSDSPNGSGEVNAVRMKNLLSQLRRMAEFIESGKSSFKLFLWKRLFSAYKGIDYRPKVLSCLLKSIGVIIDDLRSSSHAEGSSAQRTTAFLRSMRLLDQLISEALGMMLNEKDSMDCIDLDHCHSTIEKICGVLKILQAFTIFEDSVRIGQRTIASLTGSTPSMARAISSKLRDMTIRSWMVLYFLLKDSMSQQKDTIASPMTYLTNFFRGVHYSSGLRQFCHNAGKVFLKYAESELLHFDQSQERDAELSQVLFDLYGLVLNGQGHVISDHFCKLEPLKSKNALRIIPFIMQLVQKISIKDLPKSDYKSVIDKMQPIVGAPKATNTMTHNMRTYSAYMKTQINRDNLFRCLRGDGDIPWVSVKSPSVAIAEQDWYFLIGYAALAKFKSQKRTSASPTDDLSVASSFFRIDLQHKMDRWETWFRQAQTYDTLVEEDVCWSAEKLNGTRKEIRENQKLAILCYTRGVACAMRDAKQDREENEATKEKDLKVSDMFTDFGFRIYASATPPFSMEVFSLQNYMKPCSGSQGLYNVPIYPELTQFQAFRFAAQLFRRALVDKPDYWMNHYMLGKCFWKMLNHPENRSREVPFISINQPLDCFIEAIKTIPEQRREKDDPILEPHYKLVSVLHKLVRASRIEPERASEILQNSSYAQKISSCTDFDAWDEYVLSLLKALRTADKANWHHRMIVRAARIIDEGSPGSETAAEAAKGELTNQIFTKTMAVQVWRPENERSGRHFIYTSEYVRFFASLLGRLKAQSSLEALARKVRRANTNFYQHDQVWTEVCTTYVQVMRVATEAELPGITEASTLLPMQQAVFAVHSERLEFWCQNSTKSHPLLTILKEVIELKRLNGITAAGIKSYKGPVIDDLVSDTYAKLYHILRSEITASINTDQQRAVMNLGNLVSNATASGPQQDQQPQQPSDGAPPQPPMKLPILGSSPVAPQTTGRVRHVLRKDVIRSAEAACSRSIAPTASTAGPPAASSTHVVPIINGKKKSASPVTSNRSKSEPRTQARSQAGDNNGQGPDQNATAASEMSPQLTNSKPTPSQDNNADDADDESELSEADPEINRLLESSNEEEFLGRHGFEKFRSASLMSIVGDHGADDEEDEEDQQMLDADDGDEEGGAEDEQEQEEDGNAEDEGEPMDEDGPEVDEEEETKTDGPPPMFPGLLRAKHEASSDKADSEDGEDFGDEAGGDEGDGDGEPENEEAFEEEEAEPEVDEDATPLKVEEGEAEDEDEDDETQLNNADESSALAGDLDHDGSGDGERDNDTDTLAGTATVDSEVTK